MASLVQDVWLGQEPRLRARRLAPYDEAPVRVLFHPDLDQTLDDRDVASFLEALGSRVEVMAFEPRGQGGSAGRFGPESLQDLRVAAAAAPRRWPDARPLVLVGHGVGAALVLAAAAELDARGVVLLAPGVRPPAPAFLDGLDLPNRLAALRVPVLVIDPREGSGASPELMTAFARQPRGALVLVPGDRQAVLRTPWPDLVATWAAHLPAA